MGVVIDERLCPQNHSCPMIKLCPVEAITQEEFNLPTVDSDKCIECGKCVANCGKRAMKIV